MSKFFPFFAGAPSAPTRPVDRSLLKRIIFFAAALLLLWVALQLKPSPRTYRGDAQLFSDNSGSVAARTDEATPAFLRPGTILAGLVLLGLLGLAWWRYRKADAADAGDAPLSSVASLALGPGQELRIVECDGRRLLLGVTAHQISLLERLPADAPAATVNAAENAAAPPFSTFLYRAARDAENGN